LSKPPTQPNWQPVTSKDVDFFLTIPEDQTSSVDYPAYPHAHYSLPSEAEIEKFVRDKSISRKQRVNEFFRKWEEKARIRQGGRG
jgi:3-hydroxyisobutyryl-CoA hydrolase